MATIEYDWLPTKGSFKYLSNIGISKYTWIGPRHNEKTAGKFVFKCDTCNETIDVGFDASFINSDVEQCVQTCSLGRVVDLKHGILNIDLSNIKKTPNNSYPKIGDHFGFSSKGYWIYIGIDNKNVSQSIKNSFKIDCDMSALELAVLNNHTAINTHRPQHFRRR